MAEDIQSGDPSAQLDALFAALADPTRRAIVQALTEEPTTSVPALTDAFSISRQGIAKHLRVLDEAGLVERAAESGREVRYRLTPQALTPAGDWLAQADRAWAGRLARLKRSAEA